jgi:hypothetical protein
MTGVTRLFRRSTKQLHELRIGGLERHRIGANHQKGTDQILVRDLGQYPFFGSCPGARQPLGLVALHVNFAQCARTAIEAIHRNILGAGLGAQGHAVGGALDRLRTVSDLRPMAGDRDHFLDGQIMPGQRDDPVAGIGCDRMIVGQHLGRRHQHGAGQGEGEDGSEISGRDDPTWHPRTCS